MFKGAVKHIAKLKSQILDKRTLIRKGVCTSGEFELIKNNFDIVYYVSKYPDVSVSSMDPLMHYLTYGRQELRNPNSWFDAAFYFSNNEDIAKAKLDPFIHYLIAGKNEGRAAHSVLTNSRELAINKVDESPKTKASLAAQLYPDLEFINQFEWKDLNPICKEFNSSSLNIHFVIPDFGVGGGGHMNIFRMLSYFEAFGHKVTIWVFRPYHCSEEQAYQDMIKHYNFLKADLKFVDDSFTQAQGDIIFATSWDTVWPVGSAINFKRRFYFVQDYEPSFYATGAREALAESTYHKDLDAICASTWLSNLMRTKYGKWSVPFDLAADRTTFRPKDCKPNAIPRIVFYARMHTERRAVELGFMALELLAKEGVEFHVDCFGIGGKLENPPFSCTFYETRTPNQLAQIYAESDVGLVFSLTNYSLVPQEMMACGLPVVEFDCESTRAIYPDDVVTFSGPTPLEIKNSLKLLIQSESSRKRQSEKALKWVSQFCWEGAARKVSDSLCQRLVELGFKERRTLEKKLTEIKASVVIPTYNGGELFKEVMSKIQEQITPWNYEILVLDSESNDGTAEYVQSLEGVTYKKILKKDFNHGATRNVGAELAKGEFVAFITQDSLPKNNKWLFNLVSILEKYPNAAGVFGRHLPHDNATFFTKLEISEHFENFKKYPIALSQETEKPAELSDRAWQGILRFYSDNNSCLRKAIWKIIPYREVQYGEDQIWGHDVIAAGYEKLYSYDAVVKHSHDYDPDDLYERSKIDGDYFKFFFETNIVEKSRVEHIIRSFAERDTKIAKDNGLSEEELIYRLKCNEAKIRGYLYGVEKKVSMFSENSEEKSKF